MRLPSSTPAGIETESVFSRRTRPWPAQTRQGFSMTRPPPWQVGQVRSMVKKPCCARTRPWPWQVGQVTGFEPASAPVPLHDSQAISVGTRTLACLPLKASSRVISML